MVDTLKTRLKHLIKNCGYKQNEIADHVGVTPQAITKWINSGKIDKNNLSTLCQFTNSNMIWVLEGKGEPFRQGQENGVKELSAPYNMDETELLDEYRKLSSSDKARLRTITKALNQKLDKKTN